MLHRSWRFVAVVSLVLFVAACEIVLQPITISGDLVAEVYDPVGGGSPAVQESGQIAGNETLYFALSVPSARDLLFAEVDGSDLRVTLLTEGGSTLAVSDDPNFFAASTAGLSVAAEVGLESISTNFFCIGPCAAVRPQSDGYLVAVRNLSGSSRSYDLSAYTMNATDGNEPNGSSASAVGFGSGDGMAGAIEWLGDEDWFRFDGATNRQLSISVTNLAPGVALQLQRTGGIVRGSLAGATIDIVPGDLFRVFSLDGRAGPSASSRYSITTTGSSDPPITITGDLVAEVYDPLGGGSPDVQESGQIAGNATLYFELSVPSARDLLFAEVDGSDLRVTLLTEGGSTLAVSDDPNFFAASTAGLSAARAEVGLESISTNFLCIGPCAAVRPQTGGYLVAVRNLSGSSRSYDLSAYTMDATDGNEPNGSPASAVGFGSGDAVFGAIEWLGDEDWFRYDGATNRQLSLRVFDLAPGVALQFESDGVVVRGSLDGATVELRPDDVFRVFSEDGRAGPSASSRYSITTTAP